MEHIYKIYNLNTDRWYGGSGHWESKESLAKNYKRLNHVTSALKIHYSKEYIGKHIYVLKYQLVYSNKIKL